MATAPPRKMNQATVTVHRGAEKVAQKNGIRIKGDIKEHIVLTVSECAEFLRISESIVRRLIKEQRIPFFKIEGRYLFYRPTLEGWIISRTVSPDSILPGEAVVETVDEIWKHTKGGLTHGGSKKEIDS